MTKLDLPRQVTAVRLPYTPPKMVVLGQVRDLTLSNGSSTPDGKGTRGKLITM
jgi:hypothetical protein